MNKYKGNLVQFVMFFVVNTKVQISIFLYLQKLVVVVYLKKINKVIYKIKES